LALTPFGKVISNKWRVACLLLLLKEPSIPIQVNGVGRHALPLSFTSYTKPVDIFKVPE